MRVAGADDDADVGHVATQAGDRRRAPSCRRRARRRSPASSSPGGRRRPAQRAVPRGCRRRTARPARRARRASCDRSMRWSCDSWATNSGAQPPPVEQQNPVWMPGSSVAGGEVGVVVAVAGRGAVERGSEAAGLVAEHRFEDHAGAVVEFADDLVAGHERERHPVLEVERGVALDERQVGAADPGEPGAHPVPARARAVRGRRPRCTRAVRSSRRSTGDIADAMRAMPESGHRARDLQRLHRPRLPVSSVRTAEAVSCRRLGVRRADERRSGAGAGAAGRLGPVLDQPAALAGDRGEAGLGVDRHGEADRLEQGQVGRRVGVRDALVEVEALGVAVVGEHLRPGLAGGRHGVHLAGVGAVGLDRHLGGDDLVEQRAQPLDVEARARR